MCHWPDGAECSAKDATVLVRLPRRDYENVSTEITNSTRGRASFSDLQT